MKVYSIEMGGQCMNVGASVDSLLAWYCKRPRVSPDTIAGHVNNGNRYYQAMASDRTGNCWHLVSEGAIVENWRIWEFEVDDES